LFRDAQGLTPFMLAVTVRAYPAALILLDTIHRVVSKVVLPPNIFEMQGTSSTEQEHAIKNVMSAWRSSVAGTGSNPTSSKLPPPIPASLCKKTPNYELPAYWASPLCGHSPPPPPPPPPSQQQQNDFSKGYFYFINICIAII